jgi:hypothetical protein
MKVRLDLLTTSRTSPDALRYHHPGRHPAQADQDQLQHARAGADDPEHLSPAGSISTSAPARQPPSDNNGPTGMVVVDSQLGVDPSNVVSLRYGRHQHRHPAAQRHSHHRGGLTTTTRRPGVRRKHHRLVTLTANNSRRTPSAGAPRRRGNTRVHQGRASVDGLTRRQHHPTTTVTNGTL